MSKSVLMSIQPRWCRYIVAGKKSFEMRKTIPKLKTPFRCYIYCTKDNTDHVPSRIWWKVDGRGFQHIMNGMVIGEFACDDIVKIRNLGSQFIVDNGTERVTEMVARASCLYFNDMEQYFGLKDGYAWHISNFVIYDEPKSLSVFGLTRAPQSWCYVEELEAEG